MSKALLALWSVVVSAVGSQATSGFRVEIDQHANVRGFTLEGRRLDLPTPYSFFELDGELAAAERLAGAGPPAFQLSSAKAGGVMRVTSGAETRFRFEQVAKDGAKRLGVVLTWPARTEFHLAEFLNVGRLLDRDMPVGETYQGRLRYSFFVAGSGGLWVRFRADDRKWHNRAEIHVARHPDMFTVTFTWDAESELAVAAFPSLAGAIADQESWLQKQAGVRPLAEKPGAPAWLRDIKLVITVDMMRSNWEIAHDFQNLLDLAREISRIRNPKEVLFYVPGWQGAYDGVHPTYRPHPELGGDKKFREVMDYFHASGFRLMIHSTAWGVDPYHPDIDQLQKFAVLDEKGEMQGWQTPSPKWHPPRVPLKFRTPRIPLRASPGARSFSFETAPIPAACEALFTIGVAKAGKNRIRLTVNRRSVATPPGWFESHQDYQFPFALELAPGPNKVLVEATGDVDWTGIWYQIRDSYVPPTPYSSWTFPILMADITKPEVIKVFTESVRSAVRDFGIDAVHVDATSFYQRAGGLVPPGRAIGLALRDAVPGAAMAAEWFQTYEEMNFLHIVQGARQSLTNYATALRSPCEQAAPCPTRGLDALYTWLNKRSPICDFSKKYILVYPHLCAANAFVPVGKVCNVFPPRQMPPDKEELWGLLKQAKSFNYLPGLRVNYRSYGLDEDTRKAIQSLP